MIMSTIELRREIKKAIDRLPLKRLASLADYIHFSNFPPVEQRVTTAKRAIDAGKGVNWRKG